jgi:hypothetical protein
VITNLGEAAQTIEYGNGQYPWSFISSYMAQLASAVQALSAACRPAPATAKPLRSASGAACPSSAHLHVAWNTAPTLVRLSWTRLTVSGFLAISCWQNWVVADPVANGNGTAVFSEQNRLKEPGSRAHGLQPLMLAFVSARDPPPMAHNRPTADPMRPARPPGSCWVPSITRSGPGWPDEAETCAVPAGIVTCAAGGRAIPLRSHRFQRLHALEDAIKWRHARAAGPCDECDTAPDGRCEDHGRDAGLIAEYERTARQLLDAW